jgi:hypothetical protein
LLTGASYPLPHENASVASLPARKDLGNKFTDIGKYRLQS